jgi:hypothetical protein
MEVEVLKEKIRYGGGIFVLLEGGGGMMLVGSLPM